MGVPFTPLLKGLHEVRGWPLQVLRGAFEASMLGTTKVEANGDLFGDIRPSRVSPPVLERR